MKRIILIALGSLIFCSASAQADDQDSTKKTTNTAPAPDNTAKNKRDKAEQKPTPQDQSTAQVDEAVTVKVRKAIMAKKGLSTNAQNVKIITDGHVITLRGPVDSDKEKATIEKLASKYAGKRKLTSEIEVKATATSAK